MEAGRAAALKRRNGSESREVEKKRLRRLEEEALDARDKMVVAAHTAAARAERARIKSNAALVVEPRREDPHETPPPSPETCARNGIPMQPTLMSNPPSPQLSFADFVNFELDSDEEFERLLNLGEDDSPDQHDVSSSATRRTKHATRATTHGTDTLGTGTTAVTGSTALPASGAAAALAGAAAETTAAETPAAGETVTMTTEVAAMTGTTVPMTRTTSEGVVGATGHGGETLPHPTSATTPIVRPSSSGTTIEQTRQQRLVDARHHSARWTPKSRKWKRLRQSGQNSKLPEGLYAVECILDIDMTDPNEPRYKVRWADAPKEERTSWILATDFVVFESFREDVSLIRRWKLSGLSKAEFFRTDADAIAWKASKRSQGDDGEFGWCAFISVGVALELLGAGNPVTHERIQVFTKAGARRRKVAGFAGVRWKALKAFIKRLDQYGVRVDTLELENNRHKSGHHGIKGLEQLDMEPGVYLLGAFKSQMSLGHTVVLEVETDRVTVHDEDEIGGVDEIMWVHAISFVYRIKLGGN